MSVAARRGAAGCRAERRASVFSPLAVSLGADEKVSLQVHLKASNRLATRWVGDQSQFVENSAAKVISHHRETIVRAAQLQGHEERTDVLLAGGHMILAKKVRGKRLNSA